MAVPGNAVYRSVKACQGTEIEKGQGRGGRKVAKAEALCHWI